MKTKQPVKQIPLIILFIVLIMVMSFGFRFLVNRKVINEMGEGYIDDETGVPYLTEMDSYFHQRMTRDIEDYGHAGDSVVNGENWDSLSYAPEGRSTQGYQPLMSYIAIGIHKISGLFSDVPLEHITYWMAPFVSALVVIPIFLLVFRMQGFIAACTAAILAAINYGYFIHTVPGFFDTDMVISWTSAFLFLSGCLLIDSMSSSDDKDKKAGFINPRSIIYFAMFIVSLILLMASWYVYYLFAGIFAFSVVVYVLLKTFGSEKTSRKEAFGKVMPMLVFAVVFGVVIIAINPDIITGVFDNLKSIFSLGKKDIFPNAYVSVAEMRKPTLIAGGLTGLFQMKVLSGNDIGIINAVGGMIPCLAAVAMVVLLVIDIIKKRFRFEHVLLIIWFLITAVLAVRSWRFIMLFALPVAILAGLLTGRLCKLMSDNKMMDWQIFAGMIMALMLFPTIYGAYRSSGDSLPSVHYGLDYSLRHIRDNAPEDAVIVSWWDYGYFFEEKGQRRTLFDGGSQNGKRLYWVSKALATTNEDLTVNIINMLSKVGDKGTDCMLSAFGEDKSTLELMEQLLSKDRDFASELLKEKGLSSELNEIILKNLFPEEGGKPYLIITDNMSGISGWFARFGFEDDERYKEGFSILIDRAQYDTQNPKVGWHVEKDGDVATVVIENENGEYKAYSYIGEEEGGEQPYPIERILLKENGAVTTIPMTDVSAGDGIGYTVIIDLDDYTPSASVVTSLMADSVFGRLYYAEGEGLLKLKKDTETPGTASVFCIE